MKLHAQGHQKNGSVLLLVVVSTLACVVGGVILYNIYKWAKRVNDGAPQAIPGVTNSNEIPTPGNGCNIVGAWWEDTECTWQWWDGTSASPMQPPPTEPTTNVVVLGSIDGTSLALGLKRDVVTNSAVTFSELGMPVDEWGFPSDFAWSLNQPAGDPQVWILQSSTNLIDWDDVILWRMWPGYTNGWREPERAERYYRARR